MLEAEYKAWLTREGFQASTIATSLASTRNAEKKWARMATEIGPLVFNALASYRSLLKRYSRFLRDVSEQKWEPWERFVVRHYPVTAPHKLHGASSKPALTALQWQALVTTLSAHEEPSDAVLCLILSHLPSQTPREILKMELKAFGPEFSDALAPMKAKRIRFLWSYISSTHYGALVRIQRQLRKRVEALGFEADFYSLARTPVEVRNTARAA